MEKMRAARMVELGRMACEEIAVTPPQPEELLVRNNLSAICGSDLHIVFDGIVTMPDGAPHGWPGHEGVGEVIESRDDNFKPGDRVLTCPSGPNSRCFADFQTIPGAMCLKLPAYDGPVEHLLMAQQFGTTIFALRRGNFDFTGKTVMVMGQGSAGCFFAYQAKRYGAAKVIVSDLSEMRLAQAHVTGADVAVKADASGKNVKAAVMDHTGGEGADILIEAVGRSNTLLQSVDLVRSGADLVYFGLPETSEPVLYNFHDFFRKKLRAYAVHGTQLEPGLVSFRTALNWIANKEIDVSGLISHRIPIERIDEAMHVANDRIDSARKVAITF